MKFLGNIASRALARGRKGLVLFGLLAAATFGIAPSAHASAWTFSYSGAGVNVSGQVEAIWSVVDNLWSVQSITGTHNGDAITGLWSEDFGTGPYANPASGRCPGGVCNRDQDNNFLAGSDFGAGAWPFGTQVDLHFLVAGQSGQEAYSFGWITNYNSPTATEGLTANLDHPDTGRCVVGGNTPCTAVGNIQFTEVPEINASAGLEAMALLFVFGLMTREMFLRRRSSTEQA